jgi:hypothetical protein
MHTTLRGLLVLFVALALTLPLAAALGSAPMNVDGLTLEVTSVERRGNVLTVKWAVKNTSDKSKNVAFGLVGKTATTYAVDEENGTKYYALTDKEGHGLASMHKYTENDQYGISDDVAAGQTKRYWAKFPAPPPAVKTINLLFTNADPFEAIVITDK